MANKIWVIEGEYFYSPHHKYEGVFELYWVDKKGMNRCVQNFCLEESALTLAKEDKFWRLYEYPITNCLQVTRAMKNVLKGKESLSEEEKKPTSEDIEARRLARKQRREARKAKEKQK